MTWVKICGTTNLEDALLAVDAGADALGFVFYEKSSRHVDVETVREIVRELPEKVEKVGVFVDQTAEDIRGIVGQTNLTAVQLHRTPAVARAVPLVTQETVDQRFGVSKLIVVVPGEKLVDGGFFVADETKKQLYAILIDSGSPLKPGGTGKPFDWSEETRGIVQALSFVVPVIVAGGLSSTNVGEAMGLFHPWGVDVASGVESRPGKKDPNKVRAFVQAVRRAEKSA
jgi:phosphoribosylanthranilate isomerase